MPIRFERRITREMVRAEPEALFVFGDNLARAGYGGQAREMRGETNVVGIPTKRSPSMAPGAFFTDADLPAFLMAATPPFQSLAQHLARGRAVVMPADGIGTGLADLQRRAPRIWASLQRALARLEAIEPTPI